MIQIQHLTKRFAAAGATVVALNDINLEIQDGDIYGIIACPAQASPRWCGASICWNARTRAR